VTLGEGWTAGEKKAFYKANADELRQRSGFRPEDDIVSLIVVQRETGSLGLRIVQFAS
jgi:hypothetical protein